MPKEKLKYSMLIEYDDEGQCYLVTLPEWIGETNARHIIHADSYEKAAKAGKEILESLVEVARNEGDTIPEPTMASDDEEWPVSWVVKRLEAEMHDFATRLNKFEERIEPLEKDVTLEQFCKGLALLGTKYTLGITTAKGENND